MKLLNCPSCNSIGLKSDYLFCPYCGNQLIKTGKCPSCGQKNEEDAKFCNKCGSSLQTGLSAKTSSRDNISTPKVAVLDIESPPTTGITIDFSYSSSANFDFAIQTAESFSSFKQFGEGKKTLYRVNFDPSEIETSIELAKFVRGWKSSRIYAEGERTTWDTVYSFLWCYERRKASFKPELYCFGYENDYELNIWGCTQARMPFMEQADWVDWGKWLNNNADWEFDKERLKHELQKTLYSYRYCPAIRLELVEDALSAFPDKVNPKSDKNWKFVENWGQDELSPGLVVTTKKYGYEQKTIMKGVAPNGKGALLEIIKRMKYRLPDAIIK